MLIPLIMFQAGEAGEESSDSDGEQEETSHKLIRKVSTSGQIRAKVGKKQKMECECAMFYPWNRIPRASGISINQASDWQDEGSKIFFIFYFITHSFTIVDYRCCF